MVSVAKRKFSDAPAELQEGVKEFWLPEDWDDAVSISFLESRWNAFAENDTTARGEISCETILYVRDGIEVTAEDSIGWFQINACNFPTWRREHFFNTRHNCGTAHMLFAQRGWSPWYFSATALGLL